MARDEDKTIEEEAQRKERDRLVTLGLNEVVDQLMACRKKRDRLSEELDNVRRSRELDQRKSRERIDKLKETCAAYKQQVDRMMGYIQRIRDSETPVAPVQPVQDYAQTFDYVMEKRCDGDLSWLKS